MKIVFALPPVNTTGGIRVTAIYAERLQQRGHEVLALCPWRPRPGPRRILQSLRKDRKLPNLSRQTPSPFDSSPVPLRAIPRVGAIPPEEFPAADVVVATWWETALWVDALPPEKGAKAYFVQEYGASHQPQDRVAATWRLPMHHIALTSEIAGLIRAQAGPDTPVDIVPNAVDSERFDAPPRGKQSVPTVGVVYRTTPSKGLDIAFAAVTRAQTHLPDLRLLSFGLQTPRHKLPANATFVAKPSDAELKTLYRSCDAWLFPSRREGFGLPILEAMACRTPVIATPAGAAPDILGQGGGLLVRPEDPEDMARAIASICTCSDAEWRQLSQTARDIATAYTWEEATDRFEAALQRAIARQPSLAAGRREQG